MPSNAPRRSKSPDKRPARARYWSTKQLQANKVRNLMRSNPHLSKDDALDLWQDARKTRQVR